MTVTEKSSRKLITGSGWSNPLTHNFELENSTHLKVYADDELLVLGVDYSITGVGVDTGYSVTITTPGDWTTVTTWVLDVRPPISQADDVSLGGVFGARFEDGLDALTRRVQRVWDGVTRAWKTPLTESAAAGTLEVLDEDHFWIADADGNMVDGGSAADIAGAQAAASAAAASAAAALASAIAAAISAASINLPAVSVSHKHKSLQVLADGSGYEFRRDNYYSPYQYGALGNGGANDTAALVTTQTAANLNEGITGAPSGRGVIVIPPGNFSVTQIVTQNSGEKWLGLGGTITARGAAQDLFIVDHGECVVRQLRLVMPLRPTANVACFLHRAGSDCWFDGLITTGGYYGVSGTGGTDSSWMNFVVNAPYSHNAYFIGYQGLWVYRMKWDASWPVSQPTNAQLTGAMVNGAVYAVGDMVTSGGHWFQCFGAGTAPAAGNLTPDIFTNVITSSGTATWKLGRVTPSANLWIDSGCFIFKFTDCDISGGHDYSVMLTNSLATTRPQDMYFKGCETGGALYVGVHAEYADALQCYNGISHSVVSTSVGSGFSLDNTRGCSIVGNNIRGCERGVVITANARRSRVSANNVFDATTGVLANANAARFMIMGNDLSGNSALWGLNATGISIGSGCTNFRVIDNDITDCTVAGVTDASSANALKRIEGNF